VAERLAATQSAHRERVRRAARLDALWGVLLLSCRGASCDAPAPANRGVSVSPVASESQSLRAEHGTVALRRQMFSRLVERVRRHHVFSDAWSEADWAEELPVLEREVSEATDRDGLLLGLRHLSNSLRDGHLSFTSPGADERAMLSLPIELSSAGTLDSPWFVVTRSDRASGVSLGDHVLTYDGIDRGNLLEHYRFELNAATPAARMRQLARFLYQRSASDRGRLDGTPVSMTLRHGAHVVSVEPAFRRMPPAPEVASTGAVQAGSARDRKCPSPSREYDAAYELVDSGKRVCLYRAARGPFAAYPIVRHDSFRYDAAVERAADRERVRGFLAAASSVAGVLLDMRNNGGGVAADYILPWYTSRPFQGLTEWVHVDAELASTDEARLRDALRSEAALQEYRRRAESGERWWVRPFDCGAEPCTSPLPEPPVTRAPIALLLGPGCRSACDTFAAIWSRDHLGPTVGSAPSAMYTSLRYALEVRLGNEPLGEFSIALCGVRFGAEEPWLEGRPLRIDHVVEPSWPDTEYRLNLLHAAVQALHE